MRYLLLPIIIPVAVLWVFGCIFVVLIPCLAVGLALEAIGDSRGGQLIDLAGEVMFFETPPWTWLRGEF